MTQQLVVVRPFLNFARGDMIVDTAMISEILLTDYRDFVARVAPYSASKG